MIFGGLRESCKKRQREIRVKTYLRWLSKQAS